jgi:hypothetical protein
MILHNMKIQKIMKKYTDYLARRENLEKEGIVPDEIFGAERLAEMISAHMPKKKAPKIIKKMKTVISKKVEIVI